MLVYLGCKSRCLFEEAPALAHSLVHSVCLFVQGGPWGCAQPWHTVWYFQSHKIVWTSCSQTKQILFSYQPYFRPSMWQYGWDVIERRHAYICSKSNISRSGLVYKLKCLSACLALRLLNPGILKQFEIETPCIILYLLNCKTKKILFLGIFCVCDDLRFLLFSSLYLEFEPCQIGTSISGGHSLRGVELACC